MGERFGDRKTEARPLVAFGQLTFDLLERPAELVYGILWDADPVVLNGNCHVAAARSASQGYCATIGRELHRVGQKIEGNLLKRAAIGL